MTGNQYKAAIAALDLSQVAAGKFLGVSDRTSRTYAADGPTDAVARLLRLMVARNIKPDKVPAP